LRKKDGQIEALGAALNKRMEKDQKLKVKNGFFETKDFVNKNTGAVSYNSKKDHYKDTIASFTSTLEVENERLRDELGKFKDCTLSIHTSLTSIVKGREQKTLYNCLEGDLSQSELKRLYERGNLPLNSL
jgi:hypothetical protein